MSSENNRPLKCPNCDIPLDLHLDSKREPGGATVTLAASVKVPDSLYSERGQIAALTSTLLKYWRWVAEGKVKYGYGKDEQLWHDSYHEGMRFDPETKRYHFSIQTSDSPEGDSWWVGSFAYDSHKGIVDVQATTETR